MKRIFTFHPALFGFNETQIINNSLKLFLVISILFIAASSVLV